jgi:hypothetical protein
VKMYNNGPRKAMMYGGAAKRKPMMYGGMTMNKKKKKMAKGGEAFGMLSVNAGIDNNPKPTAADRIAGATKGTRKTSA